MMDVYTRLEELGIPLSPVAPAGIYATTVCYQGCLCQTSGHNCKVGATLPRTGKVGAELSLEEAQADARQCAVNLLSSLHAQLGDLNRVRQIIRMTGYVASAPGFFQQPQVLDGASQLFVDVFGPQRGRAARTAVGVSALANNQSVVIELLVEFDP